MSDDVKDVLHVKELITNEIFINKKISLKDSSDLVNNLGSNTITISNVGSAGIGTATISKWLKVTIGGTIYYIPMWT